MGVTWEEAYEPWALGGSGDLWDVDILALLREKREITQAPGEPLGSP